MSVESSNSISGFKIIKFLHLLHLLLPAVVHVDHFFLQIPDLLVVDQEEGHGHADGDDDGQTEAGRYGPKQDPPSQVIGLWRRLVHEWPRGRHVAIDPVDPGFRIVSRIPL